MSASAPVRPDVEVLIVGAGFSGIGAAIELRRQGIEDVQLVDEAEGFGGTWFWNRYPGIQVDIPSFSYQFSFAQRTSWTRTYAHGPELRAYAEHCAREHGLHDQVRFGTRVTSADYDEDAHLWHVGTSRGDTVAARALVDATGVLTQPKRPDIAGLDDFRGQVVHTARWDDGVQLAGKRVAVIGTGASAVQLIPAIADEVDHLTVFQRTPIWCMPKLDQPLPQSVHALMDRVPGARQALRLLSQGFVELTFPIAAHYHRPLGMARIFEHLARRYLAQEVPDPELRTKLTPDYALGCKRPSFHNDYLATFSREDVTLEVDPIARVTETGIETASGTHHEIDVLVLATGFKVFDAGNFPKYPVRGRDGVDLERWWAEHRHQAYEGVSVPGFPNMLLMFGPYAYNGSSYFNLVETQARHVARVLAHARSTGATEVEVRREANDRYFAEMLRRRGRQVFWQGSCARASSYYFDDHGDVPLRPTTTLETMWRARRFPLEDYAFRTSSPVPAAGAVAA